VRKALTPTERADDAPSLVPGDGVGEGSLEEVDLVGGSETVDGPLEVLEDEEAGGGV